MLYANVSIVFLVSGLHHGLREVDEGVIAGNCLVNGDDRHGLIGNEC